jgi:hypothetical protein
MMRGAHLFILPNVLELVVAVVVVDVAAAMVVAVHKFSQCNMV